MRGAEKQNKDGLVQNLRDGGQRCIVCRLGYLWATATSLAAVSDRPGSAGSLCCPRSSLPGSLDGGQGLRLTMRVG